MTKESNYIQKIKELETTVRNQRKQLQIANDSLRQKNLSLDALHYVWCDGGCSSGTHRYTKDKITEEIVRRAEIEVRRLRTWFINAHPIDKIKGTETFRSWIYPPWHWRLAMWLTNLSYNHFLKTIKQRS